MKFLNYLIATILLPLLLVVRLEARSVNLDSLQLALNDAVAADDKGKSLELYQRIGRELFSQNKYEEARQYYLRGLKPLLYIKDDQKKADLYLDISAALIRLSQYDEARDYCHRILDEVGGNIDLETRSSVFSKLSQTSRFLSDYNLAYDYELKSHEISSMLQDSMGIARSHYNFGIIFFRLNSYEKALQEYQKAMAIVSSQGKQRNMYNCLAAIGSVYEKMGQLDKSIEYSEKAMEIAQSLDYASGIAAVAYNLGSTYTLKEEDDSALKFYNQAFEIYTSAKNIDGQITALKALALLYIAQDKPQQALGYLDQGLELSEQIDNVNLTADLYKDYSLAHEKLANYKASKEFMTRYANLKDSLSNQLNLREMVDKKSRYEIEKRENEIALLKSERALFKKEQELQEMFKYTLISAALFLLVLVSLFFSRYIQQKKSNRLLEEKSRQIKQQNELLETAHTKQLEFNRLLEVKNEELEQMNRKVKLQNDELENSNEDLKQFAYVASHDLKEPLRMIGSYTSLLKRRYSEHFDETADEFMGYIVDAVGRMETLLTDLLTYSRLNTQDVSHSWLETADVVDVTLANLRLKIQEQEVNIIYDPDRMPKIKAARTQMIQLFQNLISNAIKFTDKNNPEVEINCDHEGDDYVFMIRDNGIGISKENLTKIFDMFRRLHSRQEYEGSGIGLSTCKKIVEKHQGRIWVESEEGVGSKFFFSVPVLEEANEVEGGIPMASGQVAAV